MFSLSTASRGRRLWRLQAGANTSKKSRELAGGRLWHGARITAARSCTSFNAFPLQDWDWRPVDRKLGDTVSSIWTNFVKTGSTNGPGLPEWPSFDPKTEILINFGETPKAEPGPYREKLDFIAEWTAS